jgi:uncharacterized protein
VPGATSVTSGHYGEQAIVDDLFREGHVDMAILNSSYLHEFYNDRFNTHAQNNAIKAKYPDAVRVIRSAG